MAWRLFGARPSTATMITYAVGTFQKCFMVMSQRGHATFFFNQTMYIQWCRADHVYYMVLWLGARQPAVRSIWPSSLWGRSDPNRVIYEAGLKCQSECEKSRASLPQSAGHAIPQYRRDSRGSGHCCRWCLIVWTREVMDMSINRWQTRSSKDCLLYHRVLSLWRDSDNKYRNQTVSDPRTSLAHCLSDGC